MTTFSASLAADISVTANFQARVQFIDNSIVSAGWIVTSDTGQLNPATVTAPSANSSGGYRIYKSNDAKATMYLRIEYWRGSGNNTKYKIIAGWATDGAGTITGNASTIQQLDSGAVSANHDLDVAGANNWLTIAANKDVVSGPYDYHEVFGIERDRDASGTEVDHCLNVYFCSQQTHQSQQVPDSGLVPVWQAAFLGPHPYNTSTAVIGANTLVTFPIPATGSAGGGYPGIGVVIYTNADFSIASTQVINPYGTNHTYLVFGGLNSSAFQFSRSMFRFE